MKKEEDDKSKMTIKLQRLPVVCNLKLCLETGQVFNWKRLDTLIDEAIWLGVIDVYPILFIQNGAFCDYCCLDISVPSLLIQNLVEDFFQLSLSYDQLLQRAADSSYQHLYDLVKQFEGHRLLKQNSWECLIAFICSSNNNIPRISKILFGLREEYGRTLSLPDEGIWNLQNEQGQVITLLKKDIPNELHVFPTSKELSLATDSALRGLGSGYRASYILETAKKVQEKGGEKYLEDLFQHDYTTLSQKLQEFNGVGQKVADCVCLFGYQQLQVVPIDIHMSRVICMLESQLYQGESPTVKEESEVVSPLLETHLSESPKTLKRERKDVEGFSITVRSNNFDFSKSKERFQRLFDKYAGWTHCLLFLAQLKHFQNELVPEAWISHQEHFDKRNPLYHKVKTMKK